jgi:hypothetical protein
MLTLNAKASWHDAIVHHDYSKLGKSEIKELKAFLLENNVSFCDVYHVGEVFNDTISYTFKD